MQGEILTKIVLDNLSITLVCLPDLFFTKFSDRQLTLPLGSKKVICDSQEDVCDRALINDATDVKPDLCSPRNLRY